MSNITCGEGIRKLDVAESCIARVGGIPVKEAAARHPLRYMITWAFSHVLRSTSSRSASCGTAGLSRWTRRRAVSSSSSTGLERPKTSSAPSRPACPASSTPPQLKEFAEKTVRWPGHWTALQTLKECGMLDLDQVEVGGVKVVPREVLLARIEPRLRAQPGETDVCVMYKHGRRPEGRQADPRLLPSVGRGRHGQQRVGDGQGHRLQRRHRRRHGRQGPRHGKGIVAPEDCIYGANYQYFIKELEKRNIRILETVETLA